MLWMSIPDKFIVDVSCGQMHTAAVTCDGRVYCWGDNSCNQCGGTEQEVFSIPQFISIGGDNIPGACVLKCQHSVCQIYRASASLSLVRIVQVACSSTHTVVLSETGELWTWGSGVQLGIGIESLCVMPQKIKSLLGRRVVSVACGLRHTAVIVSNRTDTDADNCTNPSSCSDKSLSAMLNRTNSALVLGEKTCRHSEERIGPRTDCGSEEQRRSSQASTDSIQNSSQEPSKMNSVQKSVEYCRGINKDKSTSSPEDIFWSAPASTGSSDSVKRHSLGCLQKPCDDISQSVELATDTAEVEEETSFTCDSSMKGKCTTERVFSNRTDASVTPARLSESRSTFLDETEAKEFLQKQLSIDETLTVAKVNLRQIGKADSAESSVSSSSPFAKTVESLLQRVPSSPVLMQEYVTNVTKSIVNNIRSSMADKLSFVYPGNTNLINTGKITTAGDVHVTEAEDRAAELRLCSENVGGVHFECFTFDILL